MSNPSRAKGTAAETAVLRYVNEHGFPWAYRLALTGAKDQGDVSLVPGNALIFEVKSVAKGATGQPPAALLADWMRQTETERDNAGADFGVLVVKRSRTTDPGKWFAYVTAGTFAQLLGATLDLPDPDAPLCTSLASLTPVLRAAGYGGVPE